MTTKTEQSLGLEWGAPLGEGNWNVWMDGNLVKLGAVTQISVVDRTTTVPPVLVEGARYIVGTGATGAWTGKDGQLAVAVDGSWQFYPLRRGWVIEDQSDGYLYVWNGTAFVKQAKDSDVTAEATARAEADAAHADALDPHPQYATPAEAAAAAPVQSVAGRTGDVLLAKADVGLANVDNTSDLNKPVSTAQQAALDTKQATLVSGTNIKTVDGESLLGAGDLIVGLQYHTESRGVAAPNATVPVHGFTALGAEADIDLLLSPKANGAIVANIPDNGTTGGNKRGATAVDFQRSRTAASQVASALQSTIGGGSNNTASGSYSCVPGGTGNLASGIYSFAAGRNTTASGDTSTAVGGNNTRAISEYATALGGLSAYARATYATVIGGANGDCYGSYGAVLGGNGCTSGAQFAAVIGGSNCRATGQYSAVLSGEGVTVSGEYSAAAGSSNNVSGNYSMATGQSNVVSTSGYAAAVGGRSNTLTKGYSVALGGIDSKDRSVGSVVQGFGSFTGTDGEAQLATMGCRGTTTDATATVITIVGATLGAASDLIALDNYQRSCLDIMVVGTDGTDEAYFWVKAAVKRGADAPSTAIVGTPAKTSEKSAGAAAWDVEVIANTTYGAAAIRVTGEAAKTIRWSASVTALELMKL